MNVSKVEWSDPNFTSATVKKIGRVYTSVGLVIDGVKMIFGSKGPFIAMPSRKNGEEWTDVCYFIDTEVREIFQKEVMESYYGLGEETLIEEKPEDQGEQGNWDWNGA